VGSKRKAVIAVNSRSPLERRRFSLAHELRHWHHKGRMLFCGGRDVCNFANGPLDPERQADAFASDLILPNYLLGPRLRRIKRPTLAAAREIADEYSASLTATLFKMTVLNRFPIVIACWRSLTRAWTFPVSRSIPANKLSVP
jgi:Zn-dependent peptidase ImmA (M78 family)